MSETLNENAGTPSVSFQPDHQFAKFRGDRQQDEQDVKEIHEELTARMAAEGALDAIDKAQNFEAFSAVTKC